MQKKPPANGDKTQNKEQEIIERRSPHRDPYAFIPGHGGSKKCGKCGRLYPATDSECTNPACKPS
ncbi:MAG: hypothetical protein WCT49_04915 [Candidatus Paceibacterota bacterium]|nr:hypothetical protein [Candidatus Paceibacterota bacterium]